MPIYIRDKTTKVIKRVTTDPNHVITDSEDKLELPEIITLKGFKVLNDNGTTRVATEKEINDSDADEERVSAKAKVRRLQLLQAVLDDPSVPQSIKDFLGGR